MSTIPPPLQMPAIPPELLGTAAAMAMVMASQVGYREGPDNATYAGEWFPMQHQPWCASQISWAAEQAGIPTSVILKHAWTPSGLAWFEERGQAFREPEPGDIGYVFYPDRGRVGHVFFVEKVWRTTDGVSRFQTLEGNSSVTGSLEGTGVWRLQRAPSSRLTFGRPAYRATGSAARTEQSEEDPMRYITIVGEPADPNTYGYTDQEWWIATDEEIGAFGQRARAVNARQRDVIRSRVLSVASQRKDGLDLVKVVGVGDDTARVFAVLGDAWWSPGEEELGSLQAAFGARRIREINQRQWDLIRTRLNQLAAVPV